MIAKIVFSSYTVKYPFKYNYKKSQLRTHTYTETHKHKECISLEARQGAFLSQEGREDQEITKKTKN